MTNINEYLNAKYPSNNNIRDSSFIYFVGKEKYKNLARYRDGDMTNSKFIYDSLIENKMDIIKCNEVIYNKVDSTLGLRLYGKFKFGDRFRIGIYNEENPSGLFDDVGNGYFASISRWEGI
ncbi:MAG: hypothetical protein IPN93_04560 [Bacteroidetes bacterium]|nr:hypothetical protein [Bacteroidota bacterium]MBK8672272.1 hypothetical protein [Bacteroidota bacterium]